MKSILLVLLLTTPVFAQFYTLDEDQFYDQTSTYEPVQRSIQDSTNDYFDQLDRQREEQERRDREFEMQMRMEDMENRLYQLETD